MPRSTPLPSPPRPDRKLLKRLEGLRWIERPYRALSYTFAVRTTSRALDAHIRRVLGTFVLPRETALEWSRQTRAHIPRYSVVVPAAGQDTYHVLWEETLVASNGTREGALEAMFSDINAKAFHHSGDFLIFHSGAVATPEGLGVMLPAQSGSGKSTLVLGLVLDGFSYLSDEGAALDPVTRRLYPYAKALSLKDGSRSLFRSNGSNLAPRRLRGQWHLPPGEIRPAAVGGPCPVRYIIFPRYDTRPTELTPMTRGEAAVELFSNSLNHSTYGERALRLVGDVLRGAACYRLSVGDLDQAVRAIRRVTRPGRRGRTRASAAVSELRSAGRGA